MTVFFVFPHPDDETIFAGGAILRHIARGDNVVWICASYGERGGESNARSSESFYRMFALAGRYPALLVFQKIAVYWLGMFRRQNRKLASIRKAEAEKVAGIYGIKKILFLEIPDMRFRWNKKELAQKLKEYFVEMKPNIVYTLHSNGITEHPDHAVLSDCVTEAVSGLKGRRLKLRLLYATFSKELAEKYKLPLLGVPSNRISEKIKLSREELVGKKTALETYESQQYLWRIFLEKHPELLENEYFVEPGW